MKENEITELIRMKVLEVIMKNQKSCSMQSDAKTLFYIIAYNDGVAALGNKLVEAITDEFRERGKA